MSRKIAISIDGSSHADRAFEWALENLVRAGDEVHLLHILESKEVSLHNPKFTSGLCMPFDEWQKVVEEAYANARELLAPYVARVKKRSLACEMQVKPGVPSDGAAIVDIAESRLHANSIVMGTRGRGKLHRALLGSTSHYVLHHATIPVIIVREPKADTEKALV